MSESQSAATLEERVRELQTAVATIITHRGMGIEGDVTAAERARLDEVKAKRAPQRAVWARAGRVGPAPTRRPPSRARS